MPNTKSTDFNRQRLKAAGNAEELNRILQEECRARCSSKLYRTLECADFIFPSLLAAEQCTSDDIAARHAELVPPGSGVLDMTCGLGIDAFHIARRAASVTMIDINPATAEAARRNSRALGLDNVEVVCADSTQWLGLSNRHFDVIFIDPARRGAGGSRLFALKDCNPDVVTLLPLLRRHADKIIIKASPMLDISHTFTELGADTDIIIYGDGKECKELTAVLPGSGKVTAGAMIFRLEDEKSANANYISGVPSGYLYEPSPEIMKAAPFKLLSSEFGLKKLDVNTHLYCSDTLCATFPGRKMRITDVLPMSGKSIKSLKGLEADVAVRNFPMKADALARKIGITRGSCGHRRLYGTTAGGKKVLIIAESLLEGAGN